MVDGTVFFPAVTVDVAFAFSGFDGKRNEARTVVCRADSVLNKCFHEHFSEMVIGPPGFCAESGNTRRRMGMRVVNEDVMKRYARLSGYLPPEVFGHDDGYFHHVVGDDANPCCVLFDNDTMGFQRPVYVGGKSHAGSETGQINTVNRRNIRHANITLQPACRFRTAGNEKLKKQKNEDNSHDMILFY